MKRMEGLRKVAASTFSATQKFLDHRPSFQFDTIEIALPAQLPNDTEFHHAKLTESNLGQWATSNICAGIKESRASLKLVRIQRDLNAALYVSAGGFHDLFTSMKADTTALHLICHDKDGYYEFLDNSAGFLSTRFLGTSIFAIVWTYDPSTACIVGVFVDRLLDSFFDLGHILRVYGECVATPYVLCIAVVVHQIQWQDISTAAGLANLRTVEGRTGFGPHGNAIENPLQQREGIFSIDDLAIWTQRVGEVAGNIKNKMRLQRIAQQMLETMLQAHKGGEMVEVPEGSMRANYRTSLHTLRERVPILERQMATDSEYLSYLQYRAEKLSGVLFAFLTHEDAVASANLAAASKRDSSSMKTIAIMTMAFLPATFFAALFAIPSLQWDKSDVVQSKFWIYWAFTLPVTILILGIWLTVVNRSWIYDRLVRNRNTDT
ncbi:uncharacterized protein F4822DRAFT_405447 [Hypoxylon trugodes]|uniref:uncharacterized protein n=1 Tax=Hypoxylon trugodes TaxID=326681 RepID=UPI002190798E|nr:uncharacterized protein F4822DRAFT_405447 [Hypoxylon trugodes]KAI1389240.1 hypothetical protein F4822DRAFT_405447 [Hypoxylon trugodes]